MSNPTLRLRTTLLRLTVVLSCWIRAYHAVLAGDIVVQDTNPLIVYQPQASWLSSSDSCTACLNPGGVASYHEAIYLPPSPNLSTAAPTPVSTDGGGEVETGSGTNSSPGSGKGRRSIMRRGVNPRRDSAGLQDLEITLSFNFTGSAIYVYGVKPLGVATAATNNTPTNMNLAFTLDSEPVGGFTSSGSPTTSGYNTNQSVFSSSNLEEAPHEFIIYVGQNSTFIFDRLVYSTNGTVNSNGTSAMPSTPLAQNTSSPSIDPKTKKHDIATFAGAIGGSVGVLALFSLGLAISIIRRRRLAARRDRLDADSLHTNGSDDSPHMSGPAPFVPRFFPDTIIPQDPPTYMAATNHNNSTLLASLSSSVYPASTLSYADVPPSSPPPPLEDVPLLAPPPPFPLAISTPPPVLPVEDMPPSIPEANAASHNLDSVGIDHSNSAVAPEFVPLLQSVENDPTRSQSRASSRSMSYDIHGNPLTNPDEEESLRYRY